MSVEILSTAAARMHTKRPHLMMMLMMMMITVTFNIPQCISDVGISHTSRRDLVHHYHPRQRRIALAARRDVDTMRKSSSTAADKSRRHFRRVDSTLIAAFNEPCFAA